MAARTTIELVAIPFIDDSLSSQTPPSPPETSPAVTSSTPLVTAVTSPPPPNREPRPYIIRNKGAKVCVTCCSIIILILLVIHLKQISNIKDYKKKPDDYLAPMYTVLSLCSTLVGLAGFGKPYGPLIAAICGLGLYLLMVLLSLPGLYDWIDKLNAFLAAIGLLFEYWIQVCIYRN